MENQVHWENNLDEGYTCKVIKKAPTYGELFLESLETGKSEFISLVPISKYFKNQDIFHWGEKCIRALDSK